MILDTWPTFWICDTLRFPLGMQRIFWILPYPKLSSRAHDPPATHPRPTRDNVFSRTKVTEGLFYFYFFAVNAVTRRFAAWYSRRRSSSADRRKWRFFIRRLTIFDELRLHKAFFDENLCVQIAVARRITAWRSRGRNCAVGGENMSCFRKVRPENWGSCPAASAIWPSLFK